MILEGLTILNKLLSSLIERRGEGSHKSSINILDHFGGVGNGTIIFCEI